MVVLVLSFKLYFLVVFTAFPLSVSRTYCGRKLAGQRQLASQKVYWKAAGKLCLDHRVANNSVQRLLPDLQLNPLNQMLRMLQLQNITKQCSLPLPASKCRTNKIIPEKCKWTQQYISITHWILDFNNKFLLTLESGILTLQNNYI